MDSQLLLLALVVVAAIGGVTWLAINARQPRLRSVFWYLLLTIAISSTTLLVVSVALFVVLARDRADSPVGSITLALAAICAAVAVPAWIGFVIQARHKAATILPR